MSTKEYYLCIFNRFVLCGFFPILRKTETENNTPDNGIRQRLSPRSLLLIFSKAFTHYGLDTTVIARNQQPQPARQAATNNNKETDRP